MLAHVIYIPGVLLLGMVVGYVLGTRAALAQAAQLKAKRKL
jgi:proteasome assembly chaperone (PAC2) family protein